MAAELEQLDRDALVMLLAAGELSPQQRLALQAGGEDAKLSGEADHLRLAQDEVFAALSALDRRDRVAAGELSAVRAAGRAMRQWQTRRTLGYATQQLPRRGLRIPTWAYPSAAAAAILVGFLVWTVNRPVTSPTAPSQEYTSYVSAQQDELADWMTDSFRTDTRADYAADDDFYDATTDSVADASVSHDMDNIFLRDDSEQ